MNYIESPLAEIRRGAGFSSQVKAADRLGVGTLHISNIERGFATASPNLVQRMAKAYGVDAKNIEKALRVARRGYLKRAAEAVQ